MASYTVTQTATQTRMRAYSLSLVGAAPSKSLLDSLPPEILLHIARYALPQPSRRTHKRANVSALAVVNRVLYVACATLIYRTVVLHSPRALALFARTAASHPALLAAHVRAFAYTHEGKALPDLHALGTAIRACSQLHTLVVPGAAVPGLVLPPLPVPLPAPKHVTLSGWGDMMSLFTRPASAAPPACPIELFRETTHLSIAGPPAVWERPREILRALGFTIGGDPDKRARALTHLCLARRASGNTDNDAEFVDDVLALRTHIPRIVVSMVPNHFAIASVADRDAFAGSMVDIGVAVRDGDNDEWSTSWMDVELGIHATGFEERYWY